MAVGNPWCNASPEASSSGARVEFVALPLAVLAAFLFRAPSFGTAMGPDELSLLVMARSIADGAFPYEIYWDVRAPLAYFLALPSASLENGFAALATLRLLIVVMHAAAAWTFFCLFGRTLGVPGAAVGSLFLLVSMNMADLHHLAMPNHLVMAMSLGAFACLVAGTRGNRPLFVCSAVVAGLLPWVMVQSVLVTSGLAALVIFADTTLRRSERLTWLLVAIFPSAAIIGAFYFWGPFDAFVRTVFLAPFGVIESAIDKDWSDWETLSELPDSIPWRVGYILTLVVGAVWLPGTVRNAPSGSFLRHAAFLVVPVSVGFLATAIIRPLPSPEYFIEAAPAAALFAAIAASRLWRWQGSRVLPRRLPRATAGLIAVVCLGAFAALPFKPARDRDVVVEPLPEAYCDNAARWIERLKPGRTVLHLSGICGIQIFGTGKPFHPPFTYAGNWFRPGASWIEDAVSVESSEGTVFRRLREALAKESSAGVVVANGLLLTVIEERGWGNFFHEGWRLVWYRHVPGHDAGFDRLAVFVRADMLAQG